MPPIYLTSDLSNYKRKPNFFNPLKKQVGGDPYIDSVILHLKGENLLDSSPLNLSPSASNLVSASTGQKKYGTSSLYFGGDSAYIVFGNSELILGTSDYTVEAWAYVTATLDNRGFWSVGSAANSIIQSELNLNSFNSVLRRYTSSYGYNYSSRLNVWTHIAQVKNGSTSTLYINGVSSGSVSDSLNNTGSYFFIGAYHSLTSYGMTGWFDSFRITKNVARYTANFDPETDTYLAY